MYILKIDQENEMNFIKLHKDIISIATMSEKNKANANVSYSRLHFSRSVWFLIGTAFVASIWTIHKMTVNSNTLDDISAKLEKHVPDTEVQSWLWTLEAKTAMMTGPLDSLSTPACKQSVVSLDGKNHEIVSHCIFYTIEILHDGDNFDASAWSDAPHHWSTEYSAKNATVMFATAYLSQEDFYPNTWISTTNPHDSGLVIIHKVTPSPVSLTLLVEPFKHWEQEFNFEDGPHALKNVVLVVDDFWDDVVTGLTGIGIAAGSVVLFPLIPEFVVGGAAIAAAEGVAGVAGSVATGSGVLGKVIGLVTSP